MCKNHGEDVDHLILHSSFTLNNEPQYLQFFNVESVLPRTIVEFINGWRLNK